jgi:hypothetical protein
MQFTRFAASVTATVALAATGVLYASHAVRASDHQDAPALLARVGADITDDYLFPSPARPGYVDFVMNVHPFIPAGMSRHFGLDPDVLYQFKISHGPLGTAAPADTALQILASGSGPNQQVTVYRKQGNGLGNPSTLGEPLGTFAFNNPKGAALKDGVVAFAGPRADSFFFDLSQFFTWLPDRNYSNPRTGDTIVFGNGAPTFNGFPAGTRSGPAWGNYFCNTAPSTNFLTETNGGFNVISIVVEVPKSLLVAKGQSPIIHLWSTASVATATQINRQLAYNQIELFARPGEKELFEIFSQHEDTNALEPFNDPYIRTALEHFTRVAHRSEAIAKVIQAVLYPDELAADLSQPGPAAYLGVETGGATGSKFGGRSLTNDGIDAALGAVFGNTIPALGLAPDDHNENACLAAQNVVSGQGGVQTQPQFPYLATPH